MSEDPEDHDSSRRPSSSTMMIRQQYVQNFLECKDGEDIKVAMKSILPFIG